MKQRLFTDLFRRLRLARGWVGAQFYGTLVLILLAVGWDRLPEKHGWQVALTLVVPLALLAGALWLQAATMRALLDDKQGRVRLLWGALTLLVWGAVGAAIWALLDWCDDQLYPWANYFNSLAPAHARVTWLAATNIRGALGFVEWILYVLVVGKLIVLGTASAQWGWRLPVRRLFRVLLDWRWWLAVVLVGLATKFTPALFFSGTPGGTPAGQVTMVAAGVVTVYLVLAAGWVLLLGWAAVLLGRAEPPTEEVLVPVPVLAGPEDKSRSAAVDTPPPDNESPA